MNTEAASIIWGGGAVVVFFVIVGFLRALVRVCPADTVLVISGFEHTLSLIHISEPTRPY